MQIEAKSEEKNCVMCAHICESVISMDWMSISCTTDAITEEHIVFPLNNVWNSLGAFHEKNICEYFKYE